MKGKSGNNSGQIIKSIVILQSDWLQEKVIRGILKYCPLPRHEIWARIEKHEQIEWDKYLRESLGNRQGLKRQEVYDLLKIYKNKGIIQIDEKSNVPRLWFIPKDKREEAIGMLRSLIWSQDNQNLPANKPFDDNIYSTNIEEMLADELAAENDEKEED